MANERIAIGIIIGLFFISLVIFFCILIVKLYIYKVKDYTKLLYQKDIEFQKALNQTIVETQEQVLSNIAQDLHDDVGQQLTYINFQLENLKLDQGELRPLLAPISESVSNVSQSIRNLSHLLSNQLFVQQDMIKAITNEIKRLQKNSKIKILSSIDAPTKKAYSSNEKIVVYRIFQEVINNCLKHAKASEIKITLSTNPNFQMTISDNGKGFDFDTIKKNRSTMGLQNMQSRATFINFILEIHTQLGEGTTIILSEKN